MTELDTLLNENSAPAVAKTLSSRILAAAETAEPANDRIERRSIWAIAGVAAMAIMAATFLFLPSADPVTEWEQIADTSGFSDLYEWVEGDDS